ncbi:MAG: protein tyrosine phosphatase family protein [Ramlibacter sp.]|nr:protein tyrosine phosphatase family protein [Ramlibacter sp.]
MDAGSLAAIHNWRPVDESLATSGQPTMEQLGTIAGAGFTTVINLALHDDARYSLADEAGAVRELGMAYEHIPVQFAAPTEGDLLAFFAAMDAHRGEKVWVHCAANMRASVFLGLYRVLRQGWARDKAFDVMDSLWEPDEVWAGFIERILAKRPAA